MENSQETNKKYTIANRDFEDKNCMYVLGVCNMCNFLFPKRIESKRYDEFQKFINQIKTTASCRFNAARRMEHHEEWSNITLIALSLYLIAVSIVVLSSKLSIFFNKDYLEPITIVISVFVLVLSVYVSGQQYGRRQQSYHACGVELEAVYLSLNKEEYNKKDVSDKIKGILQKYEFNHHSIDLQEYIWQKRGSVHKFDVKCPIFAKIRLVIHYFFSYWFVYILLLILPLVLLLIAFKK